MRSVASATTQHIAASGVTTETEGGVRTQAITSGLLSGQRSASAKATKLYQK